jgi:tetratricopeptide (TPR) repeat protein
MLKLLALAIALSAPKDPSAKEAERLAKKSIVEYNVGDFDQALADVTKAYKLDPLPGLLYNLAQCHRALHHWEKAEFFYRGYLREKPDAQNRPAVDELIKEMVDKQREATAAAPPPPLSATPPATVTMSQSAPPTPPASTTTVPLVVTPDTQRISVEPTVEGRAEPANHSRALAYTLTGVAGAGAVLAGVSAGVLIDYQSYRSGLTPGTTVQASQFDSKTNTAQIFNVLLYVGIGIAVGGLGGAVLTW